MMIFSLYPAFLKDDLHMTGSDIGWMEGVAIFLSFSMRLFSGIWSDQIRSRKPFILIGSVLATIIKPAFAVVGTAFAAASIRVIDRIGKGVRAAPIDALISDLSPQKNKGAAFGLKQSFVTLGDIVGALLASLCMWAFHHNYRLTFLMATIPAIISIFLVLRLKQPSFQTKTSPKNKSWSFSSIKDLPKEYWQTLFFCFILFTAYFSEFFVTLSLRDIGISLVALPIFMGAINCIQALFSFSLGKLADRYGHHLMLIVGVSALIAANVIFSTTERPLTLFLGVLCIGLHFGITRASIRARISEYVPPHLKGTAYAVFAFFTGFSVFAANFIAGKMSTLYGPTGPFLSGGIFATLALLLLLKMRSKTESLQKQ
jgi:MFS family permease